MSSAAAVIIPQYPSEEGRWLLEKLFEAYSQHCQHRQSKKTIALGFATERTKILNGGSFEAVLKHPLHLRFGEVLVISALCVVATGKFTDVPVHEIMAKAVVSKSLPETDLRKMTFLIKEGLRVKQPKQ